MNISGRSGAFIVLALGCIGVLGRLSVCGAADMLWLAVIVFSMLSSASIIADAIKAAASSQQTADSEEDPSRASGQEKRQ